MSVMLKAIGSPVSPPMPNIGRKASAKSIGVLKRIDPPHSEMIRAVRITTDGIEMIIVVVWKNAAIAVPMPVMNMWCAHTMNEKQTRKMSDERREMEVVWGLSEQVGADAETRTR